ncbi:hypothetical protein KI387_009653, partial [Taxus chinensis]
MEHEPKEEGKYDTPHYGKELVDRAPFPDDNVDNQLVGIFGTVQVDGTHDSGENHEDVPSMCQKNMDEARAERVSLVETKMEGPFMLARQEEATRIEEDSALTPMVVWEEQHYEHVMNSDMSKREKKREVWKPFPNRYDHDDSKLAGLFIIAFKKEHNDEELGLGKNHKSIRSTSDQEANYNIINEDRLEKQLYQKALSIKSAIPHPRIMGIIHECGGKMHMTERQWAEAATDFFEAFKNYDEAGNHRRIQCLKYPVLANMLMESEVNPFDGQEAKPYKNDPDILAMTNLVAAYQQNEILEFEKILKSNRKTIMDDPFIRNYIKDLLKNIRTQVLLKLIKPYTCIRIPFISKELNIPEKDVEQLLVSLILDNRVHGHIDQINQLLELGD